MAHNCPVYDHINSICTIKTTHPLTHSRLRTQLIYRKMRAEEKYGYNGFVYVGNGKYEAAPGAAIKDLPPSYGATNR